MKTILQKDLWSITSFLENKEYNFDKDNILTQLPEKFIDEAIKAISSWDNYEPTPLLKLNKLNDELVKDEFFINLASNEYSSVIDKKTLNTTMISPSFKDMKNGKLKIISFYAKKARGMMVRYILDNKINSEEDLKGFNYGGYTYSNEESEKLKDLVFIR